MIPRDVFSTGSASGVARLVLVIAALVGFLAMHGFDTTDGAGAHHAVPIAAAQPAAAEHAMDRLPSPTTAAAATPGSEHAPPHEAMMAGCLFVLLALAGGLVLRMLSTVDDHAAPCIASQRMLGPVPARAPPCPVFVSLCVFRL